MKPFQLPKHLEESMRFQQERVHEKHQSTPSGIKKAQSKAAARLDPLPVSAAPAMRQSQSAAGLSSSSLPSSSIPDRPLSGIGLKELTTAPAAALADLEMREQQVCVRSNPINNAPPLVKETPKQQFNTPQHVIPAQKVPEMASPTRQPPLPAKLPSHRSTASKSTSESKLSQSSVGNLSTASDSTSKTTAASKLESLSPSSNSKKNSKPSPSSQKHVRISPVVLDESEKDLERRQAKDQEIEMELERQKMQAIIQSKKQLRKEKKETITDFFLNDDSDYDPQHRKSIAVKEKHARSNQERPSKIDEDQKDSALTVSLFMQGIVEQQKAKEDRQKEIQRRNELQQRSLSVEAEAPPHTKNFHFVSHLQHKAAALSGAPSSIQDKGSVEGFAVGKENDSVSVEHSISPSKDSTEALLEINKQIAANMENMQLRLLQESSSISSLMERIAERHEELRELNLSVLCHRKELFAKVETINNNYMSLFEEMLREIMRVQRVKFKSQTKLVEEIKAMNDRLSGELFLKKEELEKEKEAQFAFRAERALLVKQINDQRVDFQKQIEKLENEHRFELGEKEKFFAFKLEENEHKLRGELNKLFTRQLQEELKLKESLYQDRIAQLAVQVEKRQQEISYWQNVAQHGSANLSNKLDAANLSKAEFKFPKIDSSTQTTIDFQEEGLWDRQNGWMLPLSRTAKIRLQWRKLYNFSRCPSCRGNGKYLHQIGAVLKQCLTRGDLTQGSVLDSIRKQQELSTIAKLKREPPPPTAVVPISESGPSALPKNVLSNRSMDTTPSLRQTPSKTNAPLTVHSATKVSPTPSRRIKELKDSEKTPCSDSEKEKDAEQVKEDYFESVLLVSREQLEDIDRDNCLVENAAFISHYLQFSKIVLPDELSLFLSNLPRAVQAITSQTLQWTVSLATLILEAKSDADRRERMKIYQQRSSNEPRSINLVTSRYQSMCSFLLSFFLVRLPFPRIYTEYTLYLFLKDLRLHYKQSDSLCLLMRMIGMLDEYTASEKDLLIAWRKSGERALAKKRAIKTEALSHRERSKLVAKHAQKREEKAANKSYVGQSVYDEEYQVTPVAIDGVNEREIIEITMLARHCLFAQPYNGVYRDKIATIRDRHSTVFNALSQYREGMSRSLWTSVEISRGVAAPLPGAPTEQGEEKTEKEDNGDGDPVETDDEEDEDKAGDTPSTKELVSDKKKKIKKGKSKKMKGKALTSSSSQKASLSSVKKTSTERIPLEFLAYAVPPLPQHVLVPLYEEGDDGENNDGFKRRKVKDDIDSQGFSHLHFYVPLDRVVRVVSALIEHCSYSGQYSTRFSRCKASKGRVFNDEAVMQIFRSIEEKTVCLYGDGSISVPDGLNSMIRSVVRLFICAPSDHTADIEDWNALGELYVHYDASTRRSQPDSLNAFHQKQWDTLREQVENYIFVVDVDYVQLVIVELLRKRARYVDQQLVKEFSRKSSTSTRSRTLSFPEFRDIVQNIAPSDENEIVDMFREALCLENDNETISPSAFVHVCRKYHVVDLVDMQKLECDDLRALTDMSVRRADEAAQEPSLFPRKLYFDNELPVDRHVEPHETTIQPARETSTSSSVTIKPTESAELDNAPTSRKQEPKAAKEEGASMSRKETTQKVKATADPPKIPRPVAKKESTEKTIDRVIKRKETKETPAEEIAEEIAAPASTTLERTVEMSKKKDLNKRSFPLKKISLNDDEESLQSCNPVQSSANIQRAGSSSTPNLEPQQLPSAKMPTKVADKPALVVNEELSKESSRKIMQELRARRLMRIGTGQLDSDSDGGDDNDDD